MVDMFKGSLLAAGPVSCESPDWEDCRLLLAVRAASDSVIALAIKAVEIDRVAPIIFTLSTLYALAAAKMVDSLMTSHVRGEKDVESLLDRIGVASDLEDVPVGVGDCGVPNTRPFTDKSFEPVQLNRFLERVGDLEVPNTLVLANKLFVFVAPKRFPETVEGLAT